MNNPSSLRRRIAVAITVPALAASALAASSATSYADPTPSGTSGSNWLVDELGEDNLIFNPNFGGFTDYGLSIDVAFAAAAGGVDAGRTRQISAALAAEIQEYITGESFGDPGSTYAGATAKALTLAQLAGADVTNYGGVNLVTRLEGVVASAAPVVGRLQDASTFGDFANTIGQTFAVKGLTLAGSNRATDATTFLLQQQCADGSFRTDFSAVGAADQSCDGAVPPGQGTVDTTAFAISALQARPNDPAARAAVAEGIAYLKGVQAPNGAFGEESGQNTNSTGLAAAALGSECEIVAADRAADWIRDLQVGADAAGTPLAGEIGAVPFDLAALKAARVEGITPQTRDQFRRASAQAVPGLLFETAGTPSVSFGLTPKFGRVGEPLTLRLRGVDEGETVCFGDVKEFRPIVGTGSQLKVDVTQNDAGKMRYGITTGPGIANERIKFLDRTRFDVTVKSQVSKGAQQAVRIKGLERGEKVRVFVKGKRVAKGKANASGRYFTRFDVTGTTGRTRVKVIGQFFNRKGFEPFQVLR